MFRDTSTAEPATTFWQAPEPRTAIARTSGAAAFGEDENGAVWHVYREIAQRIPRNAYTRHASKLADAVR
ncbi:MAG TPA: hypothetical protein VLK83_01920 [Rhodanobacteraceae bacterium]|nr:hypothetical protein [Rhodanobacteraceae bacterium]